VINTKRISIETLAINIAKEAALRSEDHFKQVGVCVLNEEGRVLSIGYNGLQSKQKIKKSFWNNRDLRRSYVIHAEINALSCISRYDNPYLLASTLSPCHSCAASIAAYGIKKVIYIEDYVKDMLANKIFKFYNIELIKYED